MNLLRKRTKYSNGIKIWCYSRKNSDINMFTKDEGKILFDTTAKIKDSGIINGDKIMIHDEEDL